MQSSHARFITVVVATVVTVTCGGDSSPTAPTTTTTSSTPAFESAEDILARCPTPAEVARSDSDLTLNFQSDPTIGQIVCSAEQSSRALTLLQAQTYRVLTIMRRLEFNAALPWTSNSLYGWMVSTIGGIRFRNDITNSYCCTAPGGGKTPLGNPNSSINIKAPTKTTNTGGWSSGSLGHPTDFRWVAPLLVLFVHEARHNSGSGKLHTCGRADDNTIAELGAWGVQYHLYLFLANRSDPRFITSSDQSAFRSSATQTCTSRFCQDTCP